MDPMTRSAAADAPNTGDSPPQENPAAEAEQAVLTPAQEDARLHDLLRREADVTRRELRAKTLETLAGSHFPAELAELIDYTDAGVCQATLSKVQKIWQQAVQKGVESRVAGCAPRAATGKSRARGTMREAISAYYNK